MFKFYECVFIIKQDLSTQEVYSILDKYQIFIEKTGSFIIKKEYWGLKNLAYSIKKNKKGHYIMMIIKSFSEGIINIKNDLHINENIIKYIILKLKKNDDILHYNLSK